MARSAIPRLPIGLQLRMRAAAAGQKRGSTVQYAAGTKRTSKTAVERDDDPIRWMAAGIPQRLMKKRPWTQALYLFIFMKRYIEQATCPSNQKPV